MKKSAGSRGRNVIAVIGIDRYHRWQRLKNAVRDATGTAAVFQQVGFEQVVDPLLDEQATRKAIESLVTDKLQALGPDDSLVLFYAGHGGTRRHVLGDKVVETGYLIPVDASSSLDEVASWIELGSWLRTVSLLPAKHILVILDACRSGIALGPIILWRDVRSRPDTPLSTLHARTSRRIITSAQGDQVALDSGPVDGHSLFTGCLIDGLTHGIARVGRRIITGSELGLHVQARVRTYPDSQQTPDFGAFDHDERGEMMIPLVIEPASDAEALVLHAGPAAEQVLPERAGHIGGLELRARLLGKFEFVRVSPGDLPEARSPPATATPASGKGMVSWYSPAMLLFHISTVLGRHSRRVAPQLLTQLSARPVEYFDYSVDSAGEPRRELWIDYVSDTGDGFNSTYAVASAVARDRLTLRDPTGHEHETQRGRILVLGGDLVYPQPSRQRYEQRLVMPYEMALPSTSAPHPDLFAIPGRHDWRDGLVAFTRRFCSTHWFAGWRTHQRRTYFALQLPHDWWLIGVDVQYASDIDAEQLAYFQAVAVEMSPDARIVLCTAEPAWLYDTREGRLASNLEYLQEQMFQGRITVSLAGDLHYYCRHSGEGGHKIVAGGGGGFLHPTHGDVVRHANAGAAHALPLGYELKASYPDVETSRRLTWKTLQLLRWNWSFGLIPALLYSLTWIMVRDGSTSAIQWSQMSLGWTPIVLVAAILSTDAARLRNRVLGGLAHGLLHLTAAVLVSWGATLLASSYAPGPMAKLVVAGAIVFAGGWIVGSCVVGLYLFVALSWFGRHREAAFSALAIQDWKNFLRLHIRSDGTLSIYPVGIHRVPRRWMPRDPTSGTGPRLVSCDPRATPPVLVETPIEVRRSEPPA